MGRFVGNIVNYVPPTATRHFHEFSKNIFLSDIETLQKIHGYLKLTLFESNLSQLFTKKNYMLQVMCCVVGNIINYVHRPQQNYPQKNLKKTFFHISAVTESYAITIYPLT